MILVSVVLILTLYFALFLGISGLAKIDRPFVEASGPGLRLRSKAVFFSPISGRLLGAIEIILAFLLALGIRIEFVAIVNAALLGLFLLFKVFLVLAKVGSNCGCFGTHELIAVDLPSVVASILVFGLAIVLAVLAQDTSANALNWVVTIIFSTAFGWLVFRTLWRRRLASNLAHAVPMGIPSVE